MSILDKLGLAQKKREDVLNIGEKKKKELIEIEEKKKKYLRIAVFVSFLLLILITLPQSTFQPVANYTVGEPWRSEDLTAPFTFSLQKTAEEIREEREEIRQNTAPIFHINHNTALAIETNLDALYRNLQLVLDSYVQWQRAEQNEESSAPNDSLRYRQERNLSSIELSNSDWNTLLEDYASVRLNNQSEESSLAVQIRTFVRQSILDMLAEGIINIEKEELNRDEITIRNLQQRTEQTINLTNVRDLDEAEETIRLRITSNFTPDVENITLQIYDQVIQPNWIYNENDTNSLLEENLGNISTTKGAVDQGQIIIRRGDIVTPDIANTLRSLAEARAATATEVEKWLRYSGEAIVVLIATLLFLIYIFLYRRKIFDSPSMFLLVFLVLGIICLASALIYPLENVNSFIVPVAVAPIILTIIFDSRVGLMATITLAILTGIIHDNSFEYLVATTTACSLGVFSVRDIKNRSQFFITTPGVVFCTYLLVIGGFALARFSGWEKFTGDLIFAAINSVFILFTYPLILFFEKSFRITTDFTLLELADTNLPLMKELMNKAPGTFHHSLQVANLAESAAAAVGANSLLCRVGAMYHDIGKMEKPGYFIENQSKTNEHDKLKPRMSALVIKAHISDGVKKAKEHELPQTIVDFIQTHHGTSLIKYFYNKAREENPDEINEDDYRYDGPTPFTPEQGILMLADSTEAASRSMKEPTYNKLENLINRIAEDHISDGQLSKCPLTFRQVQIIKESFLNILVGVYHSRIEYPEDAKDNKSGRQSEKVSVIPREQTGGNTTGSEQNDSEPGTD